MALKIPLGISDFREVREGGHTYVDKSRLISDLIDDSAKVILLPRPRRFGKTLNMSMLRAFFEKSERPAWHLFEGLAIADAGPDYRAHFQKYPVVALTFKDLKRDTWDECLRATAALLAQLFRQHSYLLSEGRMDPLDAGPFHAVMEERADKVRLENTLHDLSALLTRHHGARPVILIDEYDVPLHTSYAKGYYESAITFFRNLLSGGLKDNDQHLQKAVLTGILRVAKDSIFTGLKNLEVYTLMALEYATAFGFTEAEVTDLLGRGGCLERLTEVQRWYDGYLFGGEVIYNPWSVLSFLKRRGHPVGVYWAETSGNELIREMLIDQGLGLVPEMAQLLRGETVERLIVEQVALREVRDNPSLLWSFLLMSGYLKLVSYRRTEDGLLARLAIPNQEVLSVYRSMFMSWLEKSLGSDRRREELLRVLLRGDADACQRHLQHWLEGSASYWDTAAYDPPERFYHGFVLGVLVGLGSRYEVLSNRESGLGRCDVMIAPTTAGQPGVVLEFKVRDKDETVEQALSRAEQQVRERHYAQGLRSRGAEPVHELVFVFDGKQVHARRLAPP